MVSRVTVCMACHTVRFYDPSAAIPLRLDQLFDNPSEMDGLLFLSANMNPMDVLSVVLLTFT